MKITLVVGARPNFMKVSPIINEIKKQGLKFIKELIRKIIIEDKNTEKIIKIEIIEIYQ